jgi:hypothetical protein
MFIGYFLRKKTANSSVYLVFDAMDESYVDSRRQL